VLLLVGLSVRALAEAAGRAGLDAIGCDAFGDEDTRAACREMIVVENALRGFASVDVEAALRRTRLGPLAPRARLWRRLRRLPERLEALARTTTILGASPEALARAKDPCGLALACAEAGLDHPEIAFSTPSEPSDWMVKRRGGAGGAHIRSAPTGSAPTNMRSAASRAARSLVVRP